MKLLQSAGLTGDILKAVIVSIADDCGEIPHVSLLKAASEPPIIGPTITRSRRVRIFERDGYVCQYCDKPCGPEGSARRPTADHIIPRSRKGSNGAANLLTACYQCNHSKGDKTLAEWLGADHPLVLKFPGAEREPLIFKVIPNRPAEPTWKERYAHDAATVAEANRIKKRRQQFSQARMRDKDIIEEAQRALAAADSSKHRVGLGGSPRHSQYPAPTQAQIAEATRIAKGAMNRDRDILAKASELGGNKSHPWSLE